MPAPVAWRTVRVFISSTFLDMQAERDHLVRFVFPRLREELLKRRIHFVDVDLRWGVTSEQDALAVCREIIDECRPRFLCMLGGRYGWTPQGHDHSITADEVHYAALGAARQPHRFFYFRAPGATAAMVEEHSGQCREPPDSPNAERLARLKSSIADAGYEPFVYPARWDAAQPRLVGLEAFGQRVYDELLASINDEYGTEPPAPLDEFAEEAAAMEAFVEERTARYVVGSRQVILDEMAAFVAADGSPNILLITGAPGSGKSALLAHFFHALSQSAIAHFVGASPGSTDLRRSLRRLCHELQVATGATEPIPLSVDELIPRFSALLEQAAASHRPILLLDALNQMDPADGAHTLRWLPHALPANVRVIISSLAGPIVDALRFRREQVREERLGPLTAQDSEAIAQGFMRRYHKTLDRAQLDALLARPESASPLYLLVALEQLRTLGSYEEITHRIRQLPGDVRGLFLWILRDRLSNDPGFRDGEGKLIGAELVRNFVSYLGVSRHGLSHAELVGTIAPDDPQGNVAALERLIRPYLLRRGDLLDFAHTQLREAVEAEYLDEEHERLGKHGAIASYFCQQVEHYKRHVGHEPWHNFQDSDDWSALYPHALSELPYHQEKAGLRNELLGTLTDFDYLEARVTHVEASVDTGGRRHHGGVHGLVEDLRRASGSGMGAGPERERLSQLAETLAAQAHVLVRYPHLLWQEVFNRLYWRDAPDGPLAAWLWRLASIRPQGRPWLRARTPRSEEAGAAVRILELDSCPIAVAFLPGDAELLTVSEHGVVTRWLMGTGARVHEFQAAASPVRQAEISPWTPRVVIVADDGRIVVHNVDGPLLWEWRPPAEDGLPCSACVSPSGQLVGVGTRSGVCLVVRVADGVRVGRASLESGAVIGIRFCGSDERLLAITSEKETGHCQAFLIGVGKRGCSATRLALAAEGAEGPLGQGPFEDFDAPQDGRPWPPEFCGFSETAEGMVALLRAHARQQLCVVRPPSSAAKPGRLCPVTLFGWPFGGPPATSGDVSCGTLSPSGTIVAGGGTDYSEAHVLVLWDVHRHAGWDLPLDDGKAREVEDMPLSVRTGHGRRIVSIAVSSNGKHVVTGSRDGTCRVWATETLGAAPNPFVRDRSLGPVNLVRFSPDSGLLAFAWQDAINMGGIGLLRLTDLTCQWQESTGRPAGPMHFLEDGKRVVLHDGMRQSIALTLVDIDGDSVAFGGGLQWDGVPDIRPSGFLLAWMADDAECCLVLSLKEACCDPRFSTRVGLDADGMFVEEGTRKQPARSIYDDDLLPAPMGIRGKKGLAYVYFEEDTEAHVFEAASVPWNPEITDIDESRTLGVTLPERFWRLLDVTPGRRWAVCYRTSRDGPTTVAIYDMASGARRWAGECARGRASVAVSDDEYAFAAILADGSCITGQLRLTEQAQRFSCGDDPFVAVAFDADGSLLAARRSHRLERRDSHTCHVLASEVLYASYLVSRETSCDPRRLLRECMLLSRARWACMDIPGIQEFLDGQRSFDIAADGSQIAVGTEGGEVLVYAWESGPPAEAAPPLRPPGLQSMLAQDEEPQEEEDKEAVGPRVGSPASAGADHAEGERDIRMPLSEHVRELVARLTVVLLLWLVAAIGVAVLVHGPLLSRLLAAPAAGLVLCYPALCCELWQFARPCLRRRERLPVVGGMAAVPLAVSFLAWLSGPADQLWDALVGFAADVPFVLLVAKAIVVLTFVLLAAGFALARRAGHDVGRRATGWATTIALLFCFAPSFVSALALGTAEVFLSVVAAVRLARRC